MERRESSVVSSGREREIKRGGERGREEGAAGICDTRIYVRLFGLFQIQSHLHTHTDTAETYTHTHTLVFGHLVVFIGLTVLVVVVFSAPADRTVAPTVAACAVQAQSQSQAETSPSLWFFVFCNLFPAFHSIYTHTHTH